MKRKSMVFLAVVLTFCSAVSTVAGRKDDITLFMVPRGEATEQLGKDLVEKYGSLLISYTLGANQAVSLRGWTGSEWVTIRMDAFQQGDFFRRGPASAVIVEEAGKTVPLKMVPPESWCPAVFKITTTELRPLLHLTGRCYDISYKDWKWLAKRYNMSVDDINPEGLNIAWYHRRLAENLTSHGTGAYDRQYWVSVRRPAGHATVAPVDEEDAPEEPEVEGNPLTNEVPAAVILGAGDAEEEQSAAVDAPDSEPEVESEMVPDLQESKEAIPEVEAEEIPSEGEMQS